MRTLCPRYALTLLAIGSLALLPVGIVLAPAEAALADEEPVRIAANPGASQDTPGSADAQRPPVPARVTGNDVNIRSGPSVDYKAVGRASRGELVLLVATEGEWSRVRLLGGPIAHIFAPLVAWKEGDLRGRVSAADVQLRASPSKAFFAFKAQKLQRGDEVIVLGKVAGQDGDWLRCIAPETVHVWIHSKYVRPLTESELAGVHVDQERVARQDALTDGRTRVEREERSARARQESAFAARIADAERRLAGGLLGATDAAAWRTAGNDAPTQALARHSLDLARRIDRAVTEREIEEATRKSRAEAGRIARIESEARELEAQRRREADEARRRLDDAQRRAQQKKPLQRQVAFEGTVSMREDGAMVVIVDGGAAYEVASTRYRLLDYSGRRVRIDGRQPATGGLIDVTGLRILPSAR